MQVQPLTEINHNVVTRIYRDASAFHIHIDWRRLEQWLADPTFSAYILADGNQIRGVAGVSLHYPPSFLEPEGSGPSAWIRFIWGEPSLSDQSMDFLWKDVVTALREKGVQRVACAVINDWIAPYLKRWQFEPYTTVTNLRRTRGMIPNPPQPPLEIRDVNYEMFDEVVQVDARSFRDPLWLYSKETLHIAWRESDTFTALCIDDRIVGYQLSTLHFNSAHLARLAVLPEEQGKGYAAVLLGEMLRWFERKNVTTITVNTQGDNQASQRLYKKLGFLLIGNDVDVLLKEI